MKSTLNLIKRFIGILLLSTFLILILNLVVLFIIGLTQTPSGSPYTAADKIAEALQKTENGYVLDNASLETLEKENVWAICIDNETHQVVWNTDNLPDNIPRAYSLSDIANLTLGYVNDYPTYTGEAENGLVVLGYPQNRYWKSMWPTWDYNFIADLPKTILIVFFCNVLLIFIIYISVTGKLIKSVNPIVKGIQSLSSKQQVNIKEKGVLSELAININQTSEILQSQERQLEKREAARANWIAGISHDIRTPLSMVMGYAGQLEDDGHLTDDERKKATVILRQSEKMKNLINDLNLSSKLEYNMQPINSKKENAVALVRQVVVDCLNTDIEDKYSIEWETDNELNSCIIQADKDLLKRAVNNLIQNCINHNQNGCRVYVSVSVLDDRCTISVEDNGIGASDEQIEKLNNTPHYMVCDDNTTEQRHGLGLLIVRQIVASHNGSTIIEHSKHGGFAVKMVLSHF